MAVVVSIKLFLSWINYYYYCEEEEEEKNFPFGSSSLSQLIEIDNNRRLLAERDHWNISFRAANTISHCSSSSLQLELITIRETTIISCDRH